MKLSEYIVHLKALEPEYGDMEVIYSKDDEGNGFQPIKYTPCVGVYDGEFTQDYEETEEEINAVCIN